MAIKLEMNEQEKFVEILGDPIKWAETWLRNPEDPDQPLKLRGYQAALLKDTKNYKNMVLRYGRRTGKSVTLCADLLWWTAAQPLYDFFVNKRNKQKPIQALLLTPMESQIKMLFDTLVKLSQDSPYIQGMITKIRRSDVNEIHFSNGSIIKGMTIGISSGNKGTGIRGMSADYILLDELDFIPRDILEQSVLPISSTNAECKMRVASTPSGKREYFYDICTKSEELGWWHKHCPSWHEDNPTWLSIEACKAQGRPLYESHEYQFRSTTSAEAYEREYGAEFGEELSGVYKHELIDKSMVKYQPDLDLSDTNIFDPGFEQNPNNKYIIGVDWNTYKNGGQVVLTEYCIEPTIHTYFDHDKNEQVTIDFTNKFRLFYRKGIQVKSATQRETRKEIISLMERFKVDFVYVDYGAGDTNIEELTHYGKDHPYLQMHRKLHVVDSGSNIEHYDPLLRQTVKKRAKSMMINMAVVALEEGKMVLPKEEDERHRLLHQMRNYTVKNTTTRGDFTYEGEDHVLDAFHLSVYGFYHQFSHIMTTNLENKMKFMASPMMNSGLVPQRATTSNSPILKTQKPTISTKDPDEMDYVQSRGFIVPRFGAQTNSRNSNMFSRTSSRRIF